MLNIRPITHLFMSCIKDGNVNLITTRHVSATLMSAMKDNPGANGFIISGISSIKTLIPLYCTICTCCQATPGPCETHPSIWSLLGGWTPSSSSTGTSTPSRDRFRMDPRSNTTFYLFYANPQILTHLLFSKG